MPLTVKSNYFSKTSNRKNKRKSPDAAVTDGHCEGENMTEKEMQEHLRKELLKKIVDNGQNYTEK